MKQKEWTRKGNLKNPHVAKVVASYALPMSTLFGKPRNGVFHPALPLPGIKNYEAQNPHTLNDGVKGKLKEAIVRHKDGFRSNIDQIFLGSINYEIRQLCLEARKEAADFIHELCTFVVEFYQ